MAPDATTSAAPAVEVRGLCKRFGTVTALDGLDLHVDTGLIFGLLGPNGAGKTTSVRVLTTLARADAGEVRVFGRDVARERAAVRRDLGIVFQESSLDRELSAREHLDLQARLYHLDERSRRVGDALAWAGLEEAADRPARHLSGGMKRRLEIARGLLHRPRLLFLDEPTLGLDPAARAAVWEQLKRLRADGATTIFLTTHSMDEADALCERIGILDGGRLVTEGRPAELKAALGGDVVALGLERDDGVAALLAGVEGVREVQRDAGVGVRLRVTVVDGPRRLPALLEAARAFGVIDVTLHRPRLEHVFLHHTGHAFEPGALGAETDA